jgi:hypothetical protein
MLGSLTCGFASAATSPARASRRVINATHPGSPGSSGRTCSLSRALSSSTSIRWPASLLRDSRDLSSAPSGISSPGHPATGASPLVRPPRTPARLCHSRAGLRTTARPGTARRPSATTAGCPGKAIGYFPAPGSRRSAGPALIVGQALPVTIQWLPGSHAA